MTPALETRHTMSCGTSPARLSGVKACTTSDLSINPLLGNCSDWPGIEPSMKAAGIYRRRRLLVSTWRRCTRGSSGRIFYLPVLAYLFYLILKHRSATLFTAANPGIWREVSSANRVRLLARGRWRVRRPVLLIDGVSAGPKEPGGATLHGQSGADIPDRVETEPRAASSGVVIT